MEFLHRTDALAAKLGVQIVELPAVLGFSRASLFNYRSGRTEPTLKALRKLEEAERAAGLYPNTGKPRSQVVKEDTFPSISARQCSAEHSLRSRVEDLESQVAEMQKLIIRLSNRIDGDA